jgi:hypothetical protein
MNICNVFDASSSFLKKRTKKLLFTAGSGDGVATTRRTKFFCFFLFTKRSAFFPLALTLSACGTLPEPFYGNPGREGAILSVPPAPVLIIPTPANALLANDAAQLYAADLAAALAADDVPSIARAAAKTDWRITTTASLAGAQVTPRYTLTGPDGKTYGQIAGAPADAAAWSNGAPAALTAQAAADAKPLLKILESANAEIQGSNPNSLENRPPKIYIAGVTGAPGDGDASLALNLARDLPPLGDDITTAKADADFTVNAVVTTKPDTGHQTLIQLNWLVHDANNRSIGQVTQLHDVNLPDITPYWGDTAAAAATEAAGGIHTVISNATLHKPIS